MATIALFSAAFIVFYPFGFASLIVLFMAACVGLLTPSVISAADESLPKIRGAGFVFVLAISLFLVSFVLDTGLSGLFADFYQAGALVFGGGHVVLPMLSAFVADTVSDANLLLGYAAAQAVPGPMFTMASFLGASAAPEGANPWVWAVVATVAVFLSGLLLMLSAQSVWQGLSRHARFRSAVGSLNAAVVGILIAALYHPIGTSSLVNGWDVIAVGLGFIWLKYKRPPILLLISVFILLGLARSYL
jgi:chromate transporter